VPIFVPRTSCGSTQNPMNSAPREFAVTPGGSDCLLFLQCLTGIAWWRRNSQPRSSDRLVSVFCRGVADIRNFQRTAHFSFATKIRCNAFGGTRTRPPHRALCTLHHAPTSASPVRPEDAYFAFDRHPAGRESLGLRLISRMCCTVRFGMQSCGSPPIKATFPSSVSCPFTEYRVATPAASPLKA